MAITTPLRSSSTFERVRSTCEERGNDSNGCPESLFQVAAAARTGFFGFIADFACAASRRASFFACTEEEESFSRTIFGGRGWARDDESGRKRSNLQRATSEACTT